MRRKKYTITKMRNNQTKEEFEVEIDITLNNPIMFTQVKWGENKGRFQWRMLRKKDFKDINLR